MTLPKEDEDDELNKERKNQVIYCNKTTHKRLHAPMMMSTTHASTVLPASSLARPLRTLNNINSASHVIQLHPNNSPKLSGKRKTAVELLEESKAFYVKTERILDRKQELPHYSPGDRLLLLQHHPNRSPMLSLPSSRIREHHVFPAVTAAVATAATFLPHHQLQQQENTNSETTGTYGNGGVGFSRGREGYYATPPVEKRRLSIRKDNPIPLNVTAVKRFLSRPGSTEENLQVRKLVPSKSTCRLIGFFESSAGKTGTMTSPSSGGGGGGGVSPNNKKMRTRITFSEVLPCICQSNQPPELPHRMNKNNPSPPPPIPPKSPALNAKLRLLSQEQSQHHQPPIGRAVHPSPVSSRKPPRQPFQPQQSTPSQATGLKSQAAVFRRIQSEEAPTSITILPVSESIQAQRNLFLRNPILHKSLPDLNSPKNAKRGRGGGVKGGKIRSASTDLESCSDGGSSRISRSSSVHLDTRSNSSGSDESSNESETPFSRPGAGGRGSMGANRCERATTSDYASRSPSFKYETTSLVQTSQPWTLPPPWQDDSGVDPSAAESSTVEPDQVRRKAILRSKSDVGPSRFAPDLLPAVPPEFTGDVPLDLDQFFDTIGQHGKCPDMMINTSGRSSPVYFSSVSSVDSCCKRRHVDNMYESSDSEDMAATLQRRLLGSQPGMGEPSIVERNARIIKWLIKCRNVPVSSSIPTSGSTGQLAKLAGASPSMLPPRSSSTHIPKPATTTAYYGQSTRL